MDMRDRTRRQAQERCIWSLPADTELRRALESYDVSFSLLPLRSVQKWEPRKKLKQTPTNQRLPWSSRLGFSAQGDPKAGWCCLHAEWGAAVILIRLAGRQVQTRCCHISEETPLLAGSL